MLRTVNGNAYSHIEVCANAPYRAVWDAGFFDCFASIEDAFAATVNTTYAPNIQGMTYVSFSEFSLYGTGLDAVNMVPK